MGAVLKSKLTVNKSRLTAENEEVRFIEYHILQCVLSFFITHVVVVTFGCVVKLIAGILLIICFFCCWPREESCGSKKFNEIVTSFGEIEEILSESELKDGIVK